MLSNAAFFSALLYRLWLCTKLNNDIIQHYGFYKYAEYGTCELYADECRPVCHNTLWDASPLRSFLCWRKCPGNAHTWRLATVQKRCHAKMAHWCAFESTCTRKLVLYAAWSKYISGRAVMMVPIARLILAQQWLSRNWLSHLLLNYEDTINPCTAFIQYTVPTDWRVEQPRYNYTFPNASYAVNNAVLILLNWDYNGLWIPELDLPWTPTLRLTCVILFTYVYFHVISFGDFRYTICHCLELY